MVDCYTKQGSLLGAAALTNLISEGAKPIGSVIGGIAGRTVGSVADAVDAIKSLTPTGRALADARRAKALADPSTRKLLEMSQNLKALGMDVRDSASLAKGYESMIKAQQAEHQLAQSKTLLGRLSHTTAGQLATPLVGMSIVAGGALGVQKGIGVLNAAGINVDPSARLAAKLGVDRVLQAKPSLSAYPRAQIERMYETVFEHSPDLAKSPFRMADTIERMLNMGGEDTAHLRELSDYQKAISEPMKRQTDLFQMGSNNLMRS